MSIEKVRSYFEPLGIANRILEFEVSSATVALAAQALGCKIVCAGDARIQNSAYKAKFGTKAKMLTPEEAIALIGHAVGGVCPFAVNDGVTVYLDESLKRFETVFPACGSSNSAIEMTPEELEKYSRAKEWVSVCKLPDEN